MPARVGGARGALEIQRESDQAKSEFTRRVDWRPPAPESHRDEQTDEQLPRCNGSGNGNGHCHHHHYQDQGQDQDTTTATAPATGASCKLMRTSEIRRPDPRHASAGLSPGREERGQRRAQPAGEMLPTLKQTKPERRSGAPGASEMRADRKRAGSGRRVVAAAAARDRRSGGEIEFLCKVPSNGLAGALAAAGLVLLAGCLLPAQCQRLDDAHEELRANSDLLAIAPPFAPTRRPGGGGGGGGAGGGARDFSEGAGREPAAAASSSGAPKFQRANELEGFLDEMNHRELQSLAAGRPIEDLFQARPLSPGPSAGPSAAGSHASHSQRAPLEAREHTGGEHAGGHGVVHGAGDGAAAAGSGGGLMGSHSEQQIYSDCALILQRTYVKNIEDPKHQLIPFGKTEQACISYKHIDKAVEQAKHQLKFREFAKMRKKAAAEAAHESSPAPPPPFEVIHSSLEPPEDLVAAIGEINMAATQIIADQFDLSNDELLNGLPLIDMSKTKFWNLCPLLARQDLKCERTRFRTFTGHCNNLKHPTWGAAKTPYARYLPPIHPDGIWAPRKSIVSELMFEQPSAAVAAAAHDARDDEGDASSISATPALAHRLGARLSADSDDDDEAARELADQAHAELLREAHDNGAHLDMASSVQFARRAPFPEAGANGHGHGHAHGHAPSSGPGPAGGALSLAHQLAREHHHRQLMAAAGHALAHARRAPMGSATAAGAHAPAVALHQHSAGGQRTRSLAHELPSARLVSSVVHRDADAPNHEFTMLFMSWGQLLDHDMTRAATPPNSIKCCGQEGEGAAASAGGQLAPGPPKHKLCFPIQVPASDPFYGQFGIQCLDFRRSLAGVRPNCVLGPRVHQNANTAPIDANFVYGSSEATASSLRLFKGGRLRDRDWFRREGLKPLLPAQEVEPDQSCLGRPRDLFCFLAGDVRVNEQTHLTVLHTLYMREHNRIADKLSELNPHWDDERTFQETRHLVAATVQHALINEYIPLLIGRKMSELYNLTLAMPMAHAHHAHHQHEPPATYWHGYDPSVTTSVSNSFAAAAFRQGHTFVQATIDRFNKFHEFVSSEKLRHLFMRPFLLYQPGVMDELVSGMINRHSQSYDPFMTEELAGHLFQPPEAQFGHDLASINLQRGRDQGLPGYNLFREWCGLPRAESFEQLEPYLTNRTAFLYSKLYKHVDDIDLWSAGVAERKLPGAAIGPTFSCIIARQFSNTRRGDRFWYENPNQPSSFTPDQLVEIKKFTLAKLICTNADDLPTIQRWAFRMAHPVLNPRVDCAHLPDIDLQYWQEE